MANLEHVRILENGPEAWNRWREENPEILPDLSQIDLSGAKLVHDLRPAHGGISSGRYMLARTMGVGFVGLNLYQTDLRKSTLRETSLRNAMLHRADLSDADLSGASLAFANCSGATFRNAKLPNAYLHQSNLSYACMAGADFSDANLTQAICVKTDFSGARLLGSRVYGLSAWDIKLEAATQSDLIITPEHEPEIRVDDVKVAQFIYLLLNNSEVRTVIDTIGRKGVLILGRFTPERKAVLNAIRNRLRFLGFVPMMFDFERPTQRDFTETIKTLAGLARFIIADITNPRSSPLELQATMPDYMVPFVPLIQEDESPFPMFRDLQQKYRGWVLDVLEYDSAENLLAVFDEAVVAPALEKAAQLQIAKAEGIRTRHVADYKSNRP
jgi:uncharacterized protein YjbI with pentapeptide repeats